MVGVDLFAEADVLVFQELRGKLKQRQWWHGDFGIFLQGYTDEENCTWWLAMAVRRDLLNKVSGFKCGPRYQHMQLRIGGKHISIMHTHLPPTRRSPCTSRRHCETTSTQTS